MDEQAKVVYAFRSPADIPTSYTPGEWIALVQTEQAAPYHFTYWVVSLADKKWIVLYTTSAPEFELMRQLLASSQAAGGNQDTELLQQSFSRENAWYVIYDRDGRLFRQWNYAKAAPRLDLMEVLQAGQGQQNTPHNIISRYDQQSGWTYVVGTQNPGYQPGVVGDSVDNMLEDGLQNVSGTGLGMAIAKQLVLAHDGEIAVKGKPRSGTTVTMTFPLAKGKD